ncbi:MAG: tetratricopeptide repeat protein [Rariglobus sp.]
MTSPDFEQLKHQVLATLQHAKEAWRTQVPQRLLEALQACDQMLTSLPDEPVVGENKIPDPQEPLAKERGSLWLWRGRLLVAADKPEVVVQGLHSLDQAIARFGLLSDRFDVREELIVAWMNRGSGLFRLASKDALAEAVRSYDQAIELLKDAPDATRVSLGAAWMNRGTALMHLDEDNEPRESRDARLADAAMSFEKAIEILDPLASSQRPAKHNLASAWANLGMLRARRGEAEAAVVAHRQAVELFRPLAAEGGPREKFELAARIFNLGQACGIAGQTAAALEAGREALALASEIATEDANAGELSLRARHAVCVTLGGMLSVGSKDAPERGAQLEEASDLVEEGLAALATRGATASPGEKTAGVRLYEFGAWLYRTQQPQFLGEFLLDHVGDDPQRAQIAAAAVKTARQAFVQRSFNDTTQGGMDRVLAIVQDLGAVEVRLKALNITG